VNGAQSISGLPLRSYFPGTDEVESARYHTIFFCGTFGQRRQQWISADPDLQQLASV